MARNWIQAHNDIDLDLINPSGTIEQTSNAGFSVFEKARVDGLISPGDWVLRITGYQVILVLKSFIGQVRCVLKL